MVRSLFEREPQAGKKNPVSSRKAYVYDFSSKNFAQIFWRADFSAL